MKIKSQKTRVILVATSILCAILNLLFGQVEGNLLLEFFSWLSLFVDAILLLNIYNIVKLHKTIYGGLIYVCISLAMIGIILEIEHWPISKMLLHTSILAMAIIYTIKKIKGKEENIIYRIAKVMYVSSALLLAVFTLEHYPLVEYLSYASQVLFFMLAILYLKYHHDAIDKPEYTFDFENDTI
jgi:hypothetical protein